MILADIGVVDQLPSSTSKLDFTKLTGPSIRLFNKINTYLEKNQLVDQIEIFIGESNLEAYEVVSKGTSCAPI